MAANRLPWSLNKDCVGINFLTAASLHRVSRKKRGRWIKKSVFTRFPESKKMPLFYQKKAILPPYLTKSN